MPPIRRVSGPHVAQPPQPTVEPEPVVPHRPAPQDRLDASRLTREPDVVLRGNGPGWEDPAPAANHAGASATTFSGPLFRNGASPADAEQGSLGDCYFVAGMASLAAAMPDAVMRAMRPMDDGSVEVTFHERDVVSGQFHPVKIRVDAELYARGDSPLYGKAKGDKQSMELWFPLMEKAWATWKGGYDTVGKGGVQNQVFEAVLGRPAGWWEMGPQSDPQQVWDTIQVTLENKLPLGAATLSLDDGRYANTGVYANHGYSVLGAEEVNGERFVTLRNPWGSGEPRNGDGADDGVFKLKLDDFQKLFGQLQFTLLQ